MGFNVPMSHKITAAADLLLMPSRFEPCGLNQLYAMAYGTAPVAHATGGLRDTVLPFNPWDGAQTLFLSHIYVYIHGGNSQPEAIGHSRTFLQLESGASRACTACSLVGWELMSLNVVPIRSLGDAWWGVPR